MEMFLSIIRAYWLAALLVIAAVVLLILGAPTQAALAGAGFALFGAALTRGIDVAKERHAAATEAQTSRRRDLDETRRLTYAALLAPGVSRDPVLIATIINALAHHGLGVDPDVAARQLQAGQTTSESRAWLREQIDLISAKLGDSPNLQVAQPGDEATATATTPSKDLDSS